MFPKKNMFKYFFILFILLNPLSLFSFNIVFKPRSQTSSIVAMAAPGDLPSKLANNAATPKESCRQVSQTEYHGDGSRTVSTTMTCSKKEKYDKDGKLIKKTDTSNKKYQSAQKHFFGSPGACSNSAKKII